MFIRLFFLCFISEATISNGLLHIDVPVLGDQQEFTYKSSVLTNDVRPAENMDDRDKWGKRES